jgi:hypothetical protein
MESRICKAIEVRKKRKEDRHQKRPRKMNQSSPPIKTTQPQWSM